MNKLWQSYNGKLDENDRTATTQNNRDKPHKHNVDPKDTVWFHLYKIEKEAKWVYGIKIQDSNLCGRQPVGTGNGQKGLMRFW